MVFERLRRRRRGLLCVEFVEVVTDYLEDALSPRDRARFESHVAECDGCDQYLAQIRRTVELTGALRVQDVDALTPEARSTLLGAFRAYHAGG
jgi:anti-sigma factor RsiW